ncbi:MAG: hypothetical protein HZA91_03555 [Verrucomicrobia bacterium]|nr:hypothetical protein [Verrucomicrobiota bacterium]
MNPETLVKFGISHTTTNIDWWTNALGRIAKRRAEESPRYDEYRDFLGRFLTADDANAIGFSLRDLSDADKWLLLFVIDEFYDQEIIYHETEEHWHTVWRHCMEEFFAPGYDYIQRTPNVLNRRDLDHAWACLRAAVS